LIATLAYLVNGNSFEIVDLILNNYNRDIDSKSDIDAHAEPARDRAAIADRIGYPLPTTIELSTEDS
jgi:hypothetical protein